MNEEMSEGGAVGESVDGASYLSTVVETLYQRAGNEGGRTAYTYLLEGEMEAERRTYGEIFHRAVAIGTTLAARTTRGDRALLMFPHGPEFLDAFLGCLLAGVVAVPAYPPRPNRPDPRIAVIAKDSEAQLALTSGSVLEDIERRQEMTPQIGGLQWIATDSLGAEKETPEGDHLDLPIDSLAYLQYTSGSTAHPKGVMVSHTNLIHNLTSLRAAGRFTKDDVAVSWLPTFHDMGLVEGLLLPLFVGFPAVVMSPTAFLRRPIRWLKAITEYGATNSGGPDVAYRLCVDRTTPEERAGLDLSSWRAAYNGAEPVRSETLSAFSQTFAEHGFDPTAHYPGYGLAEATLFVAGGPLDREPTLLAVDSDELQRGRVVQVEDDGRGKTLVSTGPPVLDTDVRIVSPESFTQASPGEIGEIWVASPSVTLGYWQKPEETEETYHAFLSDTGEGPYLRTGDLGFMHEGELVVTGRLKDLIIIRGLNHYPQDIEWTVERSHPDLRPHGCAAFSVDDRGEEQLVLVAEVKREARKSFDLDQIADRLVTSIAEEHEVHLAALALIEPGSLPKTSSGKIARRACRTGYLDGRLPILARWEAPSPSPAPEVGSAPQVKSDRSRLEIQNWLIAELARNFHLDVTKLDPEAAFTHYGIDSLGALQLTEALETWLGIPLEDTLLADFPSVAAVAAHLGAEPEAVE